MTSQNVLVVKDKVQRYLTDDFLNKVEIDNDGDFTARHGSARIFINVSDWGDDETLVRILVPLLREVSPTNELFRHVAYHSHDFHFGRLGLVDRGDTCEILFTHTLLGDFIDPEELKSAVGGMLMTAEDLDNELQQKFGGQRFHEDVDT